MSAGASPQTVFFQVLACDHIGVSASDRLPGNDRPVGERVGPATPSLSQPAPNEQIAMTYVVMAYVAMAYVVMAYVIMAACSQRANSTLVMT